MAESGRRADEAGAVARGSGVRLRPATPADVPFLASLVTHDDVEPFLAVVRPRNEEEIRFEVERALARPDELGRFVIEVEADGEWRPAGAVGFDLTNRRSRIVNVGGLAIHPDHRGRRLADAAARLLQRHLLLELGFHRVQLEIYGFNERAVAHAERAGFVREGVRRKAYLRHGGWVDGVLFGLVAEDLEEDAREGSPPESQQRTFDGGGSGGTTDQ